MIRAIHPWTSFVIIPVVAIRIGVARLPGECTTMHVVASVAAALLGAVVPAGSTRRPPSGETIGAAPAPIAESVR